MGHRTVRPRRRTLVLSVVVATVVSGTCQAANFVVDRTDDEPTATACTAAANDCSLRGAIIAANALAASQTPEASDIAVPAGTYTLSQSVSCSYRVRNCSFASCTSTSSQLPLCINAPVTIHGEGAATTIIDANMLDEAVFVAADAVVGLQGLTIRNGSTTSPGFLLDYVTGGGLRNEGTLALTETVITKNHTWGIGGGIYNTGQLTLLRATVSFNDASKPPDVANAGGIYNARSASLTLVDSTIRDNSSDYGGGIDDSGDVVVRGSTISGNVATTNDGGGIRVYGIPGFPATLTMVDSTVSGNQAGRSGGGLFLSATSTAHLDSVTVTDNSGGHFFPSGGGFGGGIMNDHPHSTVTLRNTVVAGNSTTGNNANDCGTGSAGGTSAVVTSEGYNLIKDTTLCMIQGDTTGNLTGVDAMLAPLADNGGPTLTHALLPSSPAIDHGNPAGCKDDQDAVLAKDQRGGTRPLDGDDDGDARCDIGAFELGSGLVISRVSPSEGGDSGTVTVVVRGSGLQPGATIKLVRSGEPDVVGTPTTVDTSGLVATTRFALAGTAHGLWDLVVTNPDDTSATSTGAFTVATARTPDLFVDLAGPPALRAGIPRRFVLIYGNRGNIDAFAVPLLFGAAVGFEMRPLFDIAPPPRQFGKITVQDFGAFYLEIVAGDGPPSNELPLLLPVVPAGFSGVLEVTIKAAAVGPALPIRLEIGEPLFDGAPQPAAVAALVQGAKDKAERLFSYRIPSAFDPDLATYLGAQLDTVVSDGTAALVTSTGPKVYSLTQLSYDLASFGAVWADTHPTLPALASNPAIHWTPPPFLSRLARMVGDMCVAPARADLTCVCGIPTLTLGLLCCEGCSCPDHDISHPPPQCGLDDIAKGKGDCKLPRTPSDCRDIGFKVVSGKDSDGNDVTICTQNVKCVVSNTVSGVSCKRFPLKRAKASDPNDKTGPLGGGDAHAITTSVPLRYVIEFENEPTATAPAAEVVVTDQLDPDLVDLATLSLGPIDFGSHQVIPPPGSTSFTQDVDLRPDTNLLVRIAAKLDHDTSTLTWDFTSLDPVTKQPPGDPLAGFLPPNVTPPEGDGHVLFAVAVKGSPATGTQIANQAHIVFDANAPIDTPVWTNTIDVTPPTSQIASVTAIDPCSRDLHVTWSGNDVGAGIGAFEIAVSEDGGPFAPWLATAATGGTFHGAWGKSYAFRSVATDLAGNVESAPAAASQPIALGNCGPHDLAITKITPTKKVKLGVTHPALRSLVKVEIQNRSAKPQTIDDDASLARLVTLSAHSLGNCPDPTVALHVGKPQKALPLTLKSKGKLSVVFDAIVECVNDAAAGPGHEDFSLSATVEETSLGDTDAHALDDTCPRIVDPPIKDPFPDGKIAEKGCGGKRAGGGLGGPVLVDVTVK